MEDPSRSNVLGNAGVEFADDLIRGLGAETNAAKLCLSQDADS